MTLLEALVALVILGLSAVGCLQRFQSDATAVRRAAEWERAVAAAESRMEEAKLHPAESGVRVEAWSGRSSVRDLQVSVRLPDGATFVLHRLLRRAE